MSGRVKLVVEKHSDGYVAYPIGTKAVIVGQGDTFDEALTDVRSAIKFHVETFGPLDDEEDLTEAYIAEAEIA